MLGLSESLLTAAVLMKDPVHAALIMLNCTASLIPTTAELFIAAEIPGYNCSVKTVLRLY